MSRKKKSAQQDVVVADTSAEVVTFQVFFHGALIKGLVKSWQEQEIEAFMKGRGLSNREPSDKYLDALAKY